MFHKSDKMVLNALLHNQFIYLRARFSIDMTRKGIHLEILLHVGEGWFISLKKYCVTIGGNQWCDCRARRTSTQLRTAITGFAPAL